MAKVGSSELVDAPAKPKGGRTSRHADLIKAIIADRAANGRTETGPYAEIRAIRSEYAARFHCHAPPSRSTIARDLADARSGPYLVHNQGAVLNRPPFVIVRPYPSKGVCAMTDTPKLFSQAMQVLAVSPNEVARLCGIGRTSLYAAIGKGE